MEKQELQARTVIKLNPETVRNPMFAGSMMVVKQLSPWGAQGYVQALGKECKPGGHTYRAKWEEMEIVGTVERTSFTRDQENDIANYFKRLEKCRDEKK